MLGKYRPVQVASAVTAGIARSRAVRNVSVCGRRGRDPGLLLGGQVN